jgi:hypothetical protein
LRDTLELELRNVPVALITTTARVPVVTKKNGVYHLQHSHAQGVLESWGTPQADRALLRSGYDRLLRMAGCREGDTVVLAWPGGLRGGASGSGSVKWRSWPAEIEAKAMPSGFGNWSDTADGVRGLETITLPDPLFGISKEVVASHGESVVPQVEKILLTRRGG